MLLFFLKRGFFEGKNRGKCGEDFLVFCHKDIYLIGNKYAYACFFEEKNLKIEWLSDRLILFYIKKYLFKINPIRVVFFYKKSQKMDNL